MAEARPVAQVAALAPVQVEAPALVLPAAQLAAPVLPPVREQEVVPAVRQVAPTQMGLSAAVRQLALAVVQGQELEVVLLAGRLALALARLVVAVPAVPPAAPALAAERAQSALPWAI